MKPYFTIPADFHEESLPEFLVPNLSVPVREVYGAIANAPVKSCRQSSGIPEGIPEELRGYVGECRRHGVEFNCLLNANCMSGADLTASGQRRLHAWLERLADIGIRRITVAIPTVIDYVSCHFPEMEIWVSIVTGLDSARKIRIFVRNRNLSGIYLHENLYRNLPELEKAVLACQDFGIEPGMIVNQLCDPDCPYRQYHYDLVSHYGTESEKPHLGRYGAWCKLQRLENPRSMLALPWVRPNDLHRYIDIGVRKFKVAGRDLIKFGADFGKVVQAYNAPDFRGSLSDLLFCYSSVDMRDAWLMDNDEEMDKFMDAVFAGRVQCRDCDPVKCGFCQNLAPRLFRHGKAVEALKTSFQSKIDESMNLD